MTNTFQDLLKGMNESVDTKSQIDEFVQAFSHVIDIFESMKSDNANERQQHRDMVAASITELKKLLPEVQNGIDGKDGERGIDGKDGKDADEQKIVDTVLAQIQLPEQKEVLLDGPDEIRNKLELLQDDDRLDISAIKGLDEHEKRIIALEKRPTSGWSAASGGRIMKYYDLSPKLDGATKTFTLPAFWRIISILSSSTPSPMRENTDYTVDGSAMQITFTAQVDASTTLAQPQTLLILYAEA